MIINRLIIKNFRSYEDINTFDFKIDNDKNIILIGGENGAGKSTLFQAIKLCLYGPLAYNYQSQNSLYISKIKSNINSNAYKKENIEAFITLEIELEENTEKSFYTITRKWNVDKNKLFETFTVVKNGKSLNESEIDYFTNYLMTLIPPEIFNFIFFDGENISEFFLGKNYNHHIRQAFLTLSNLNNFEILKKHLLLNTKDLFDSKDQANLIFHEYNAVSKLVEDLENNLSDLNNSLTEILREIEELENKKAELERQFRSSGGILLDEKQNLILEINSLENKREELNQKIKDFCNDILPFLIVKDKLSILKEQIMLEDDYNAYIKTKEKLQPQLIKNILQSLPINIDNIAEISISFANNLIENMYSNTFSNFVPLHNLSFDDKNSVLQTINEILNFKEEDVLKIYDEINQINNRINEIRQILNNQDDNFINTFIKNITKMNDDIAKKLIEKNNLENQINDIELQLSNQLIKKEKLYNQYLDLLKNNNIKDISVKLLDMLDQLTESILKDKIKELQKNFIYIITNIFRKKGFIEDVEILDDFSINLYTKQLFNLFEIKNLINNIGFDELTKKYGRKFILDLFNYYSVDNFNELSNKIEKIEQNQFIILRTKIDINNLSSGEKQIYLLSLYWALIKTAGLNVPFIIDTPYARIDEIHRDNITTFYFPNISKQVIILSTNKEIDKDSYVKIKPFTSKQYLLIYNTKDKRTTINENKYFFEV